MRITKEAQSNTNLINTLRNLNKLNPSPNIDLSNLHQQEKINNVSNLIKVNIIKNQNKLPIDFIYNEQKYIIKKKDTNNTRHSLIYTQEKNNNKLKENYFKKKMSKSPKLSLLSIVSCSNAIPLKRLELIAEALVKTDFPVDWTHIGSGPTLEKISII